MAQTAAVIEAERPPYLFAAVAAAVVLLGYVVSLAPSVTFWDAGEFIAAAHILGIPHPPGTPLFVLLGHVWDSVIPGLSTAYKTNLMSATFSAGSAGLLFLFMHAGLAKGTEGMDAAAAKLFRIGGAFAATLVAAFTFTNWQNSNETEVYQIAMFSIGLIAWLCWLWRRDRGGKRGSHELLLIVYVLGAALGNHLMALLVGPAVIAYMFHVLRTDPAGDARERREQWIELGVIVSLWIMMVGMGVANWKVIALGYLFFLATLWFAAPELTGILGSMAVAAYFVFTRLGFSQAFAVVALFLVVAVVFAQRRQAGMFPVIALIVSAIGVSTYAFLFIRAGHNPFINEADPSTLRNLWAVIGREQYPPRSPFDNPIYQSGSDNPGRFVMPFDFGSPAGGGTPSLTLFGLQIGNYLQYFNWQFANSFNRLEPVFGLPFRPLVTMAFIALGVLGALEQRRWDRSVFWFHFVAWATTSAGLVLYLNFKPGFSIGYEWFQDREMHEVRERDYFYTVSYVMFGLWAGLGVAVLFQRLRDRLGRWQSAAPVFVLALLPFLLNFSAASRKHIPSAELPRDFAYDMLQSVEPYGLLFTNGDNDTFPLWYAQEVEGIRQDVMVVNLSLINTDWYIRQLRDNPARPYRPDSTALALYGAVEGPPPACTPRWADTLDAWARAAGRRPPDRSLGMAMCLHTLSDDQILSVVPRLLERPLNFRVGNIVHTYPANTPFYVKDQMVLRLILEQWGKRPIFFALTAGSGNRMDLEPYITQRALVFKLHNDTVQLRPGLGTSPFGAGQPLLDVEWTRRLAHGAYRYARLFEADSLRLDPTDDNIAANLSFPMRSLGFDYLQRNDIPSAVRELDMALHLSPTDEQLRTYIAQLRAVSVAPLLTDSAAVRQDSAKR